MNIAAEVLERLLVAKELMQRVRFHPAEQPDRLTLAMQILAAHDAAELVASGIAAHLGRAPGKDKAYLMDYLAAIRGSGENQDVPGREFMRGLNEVRKGIKHFGLFPDAKQWHSVALHTWDYLSAWCRDYLGLSFEDLDQTELVETKAVKAKCGEAHQAYREAKYKESLECLARTLDLAFQNNLALRGMVVGIPSAEDAIRLAAFGVNANDFLTLQEFLPRVDRARDGSRKVRWEQEKYGHPGNWRQDAVEFCLKTLLSVVLRIQHAEWIPGALSFGLVYEHTITALEDGVEIFQEGWTDPSMIMKKRIVVRTLRKGESIRCHVKRAEPDIWSPPGQERQTPTFTVVNFEEKLFGGVLAERVRVTCVPRDDDWVRENFGELPELPFEEE